MRHGGWLIALALLGGCDGREQSALDNLADGANATAIENKVEAEAMAVMEPLSPPAPGTPGGLPVNPVPPQVGTIAPDSAQGAVQVVQGYYEMLDEKRFDDAQDLWSDSSAVGSQDDAAFARRFNGFSEIHANVGAPGEMDGAAGSIFITVPVQVYARVAADGRPYYALRQVVLRRINDVTGSSEADRRWHISAIGPYAPVAETALSPISATDGISRKRSP